VARPGGRDLTHPRHRQPIQRRPPIAFHYHVSSLSTFSTRAPALYPVGEDEFSGRHVRNTGLAIARPMSARQVIGYTVVSRRALPEVSFLRAASAAIPEPSSNSVPGSGTGCGTSNFTT